MFHFLTGLLLQLLVILSEYLTSIMHDIEPHFQWRDQYQSAKDQHSPFYGRTYSEFQFSQKVYNYFIHPQWDEFGSSTLYLKVLFVDYENGAAILEFIGEWNDCLHNDVKFLKREVVDPMIECGINKYVLICENVLNFHGSDDCYYEEWYEEVSEEEGWICMLNTLEHVEQELKDTRLQYFVNFGEQFNGLNWRSQKPKFVCQAVEALVYGDVKRLI